MAQDQGICHGVVVAVVENGTQHPPRIDGFGHTDTAQRGETPTNVFEKVEKVKTAPSVSINLMHLT